MAYQTPITIKDALERIHRHDFVLPAIQREYVWKTSQIEALFDSLMRGYPIGAFLFWRVEVGHLGDFQFYDFMLYYHEKDRPHCPPLTTPAHTGVTAILDGQQRLTALNIGLRGSHATKELRKWWNNPDAFPEKKLYLNLLAPADDNDDNLIYDFRFLRERQAERRTESEYWYPVSEILQMADTTEIFDYLHERDLISDKYSFKSLDRLHSVVHKEGVIAYYEEKDQDLDKVLQIFIRTNSGGTPLSYSDLLMSIATAQWAKLDARKEVLSLVDELNATRLGFRFSKDFVLKAGLMLSGISSVGFKVTNFNLQNMAILEANWSQIADALRLTVRLVAHFGFSEKTLGADSALLPLAHYLYFRKLSASYLTADQHRDDRESIKAWLSHTLLKSGVWGSGLDTLLTMLRTAIDEEGADGFPVEGLNAVMVRRGRSLRFEEDEIEDLLDIGYGDRRTFTLLAMLYPFIDLSNEFHIDHVYPRRLFTPKRMEKAGVPEALRDDYRDRSNRLANLQLLEGRLNEAKGGKPPLRWAHDHFSNPAKREHFLYTHDLQDLRESIVDFDEFYQARRARLAERLRVLLGLET